MKIVKNPLTNIKIAEFDNQTDNAKNKEIKDNFFIDISFKFKEKNINNKITAIKQSEE